MAKNNIVIKENGDFKVVLKEGQSMDNVDMTIEEGRELCHEMVEKFYNYYGEDND